MLTSQRLKVVLLTIDHLRTWGLGKRFRDKHQSNVTCAAVHKYRMWPQLHMEPFLAVEFRMV